MARKIEEGVRVIKSQARHLGPELGWNVERVTRIELALSAWEALSAPLENEAIAPVGNEATQTDWVG